MQRLTLIFVLWVAIFLGGTPFLKAEETQQDVSTTFESGNKAFEAGQFTQALKDYEFVYSQGKFSETMLYRLAFMYENLRQYPPAIYYLKKAAQEYGEQDTDAKIRQLIQRQGSTRFFTGDPWNAYLTFFRSWGWLIYASFGLSIVGLIAHFLLPNRRQPTWRQLAMVGAWSMLILSGLVLFHRSYLVPSRAVLMENTAFYTAPGFSANHYLNTFSLGETLDIEDRNDIWLEVSAGGKQWWVPNWVVREL